MDRSFEGLGHDNGGNLFRWTHRFREAQSPSRTLIEHERLPLAGQFDVVVLRFSISLKLSHSDERYPGS